MVKITNMILQSFKKTLCRFAAIIFSLVMWPHLTPFQCCNSTTVQCNAGFEKRRYYIFWENYIYNFFLDFLHKYMRTRTNAYIKMGRTSTWHFATAQCTNVNNILSKSKNIGYDLVWYKKHVKVWISQEVIYYDSCQLQLQSVVYRRLKYSAEAKVFYYLAFGFSRRSFILNIQLQFCLKKVLFLS